ncbi:MAG: ABC transporter ATP-binding protein [bacterium]|nr:ABC transporter ATP-binding protein [bacterium]
MDNIIQTQNLVRKFGKTVAVDHISLQVKKGSIYGFLGENGAGKTTTIKMMLGLLKPTDGTVEVLGYNPLKDSVAIKKRVGYVPEDQTMYSWMTVTEICKFTGSFYPTWNNKLAEDLLTRFDLPKSKKIKTLSRGMQAKVMLTLALAHEPELLILDDPTSGLDAIVRREFLESIVDLIEQEGRTVFFSSHIINEVERVADYIGIIHNGKLVIETELEQLKQQTKKLRLIFESNPPELGSVPNLLRVEKSAHELILTIADFNDRKLAELQNRFRAKSAEVIDMNLEDIFVEYCRKRN